MVGNYITKFCNIDMLTAFLAGCLSIVVTIFGEDHTGITVAIVFFLIDTVTGVIKAKTIGEQLTSTRFYSSIRKAYVMLILFVTLAGLVLIYPELKYLVIVLPSLIAVNEAHSIIENLNQIYPNNITSTYLSIVGNIKDNVNKQITKK